MGWGRKERSGRIWPMFRGFVCPRWDHLAFGLKCNFLTVFVSSFCSIQYLFVLKWRRFKVVPKTKLFIKVRMIFERVNHRRNLSLHIRNSISLISSSPPPPSLSNLCSAKSCMPMSVSVSGHWSLKQKKTFQPVSWLWNNDRF